MDAQRDIAEIVHQRPNLIYVIGCPGSGKGTLCKLLVQNHNCHHISVGDLLRSLTHEQDQNFHIKEYVQESKLVPTKMIVDILKRAIMEKVGAHHATLIDGFPRRLDQGTASEHAIGKPDIVLFFDCDMNVALERYLTRKLEGRLDDDKELFHRRYDEFERFNPAILAYYRDLGVLIEIKTNEETDITYRNLIATLRLNGKWI